MTSFLELQDNRLTGEIPGVGRARGRGMAAAERHKWDRTLPRRPKGRALDLTSGLALHKWARDAFFSPYVFSAVRQARYHRSSGA